jgi:hypothetical protein
MLFRGAILTALVMVSTSAAVLPKLRLDDSVRPARYGAELTLATDATIVSGAIDMDVELDRPSSLVWLNAVDPALREADVRAARAGLFPGHDGSEACPHTSVHAIRVSRRGARVSGLGPAEFQDALAVEPPCSRPRGKASRRSTRLKSPLPSSDARGAGVAQFLAAE